jgi:hypothetical protein
MKGMRAIGGFIDSFDPIDVVAAVGAGLLTVGTAVIWLPAAPLVLGGLLLAYAINASRNEPPEVPS